MPSVARMSESAYLRVLLGAPLSSERKGGSEH